MGFQDVNFSYLAPNTRVTFSSPALDGNLNLGSNIFPISPPWDSRMQISITWPQLHGQSRGQTYRHSDGQRHGQSHGQFCRQSVGAAFARGARVSLKNRRCAAVCPRAPRSHALQRNKLAPIDAQGRTEATRARGLKTERFPRGGSTHPYKIAPRLRARSARWRRSGARNAREPPPARAACAQARCYFIWVGTPTPRETFRLFPCEFGALWGRPPKIHCLVSCAAFALALKMGAPHF